MRYGFGSGARWLLSLQARETSIQKFRTRTRVKKLFKISTGLDRVSWSRFRRARDAEPPGGIFMSGLREPLLPRFPGTRLNAGSSYARGPGDFPRTFRVLPFKAQTELHASALLSISGRALAIFAMHTRGASRRFGRERHKARGARNFENTLSRCSAQRVEVTRGGAHAHTRGHV